MAKDGREFAGDRPRVLLIHNFLTPYRVPLFAELARRFDLEVWILGDVRRIREWEGKAPEEAFCWRALPHVSLPAGSRDYRILLNPTLPRELGGHAHDALICCGWDTPASFYAAWRARRAGTPLVVWSGSTAGEPSWRRTLAGWPVRRLVRSADAWLAYGTRAKAYLESLGADGGRVFCAYNTVETEAFAEKSRDAAGRLEAIKEAYGVKSRFVVLYCGQLIERKGLGDLIPAFARFAEGRDDVALLVAGSGPREEAFRKLASREGAGDRVVFSGFVPREDLPGVYAAADLMALPSREEVWGLVINEALACGVPVLTTENVGASEDLIEEGVNGYVVPAGAPAAITEALERHFDRGNNRGAMAESARKSMESFTIAAAADAFERAVQCAIAKQE
jgi:glycosyltransferase involved in cell wall biosynthesis